MSYVLQQKHHTYFNYDVNRLANVCLDNSESLYQLWRKRENTFIVYLFSQCKLKQKHHGKLRSFYWGYQPPPPLLIEYAMWCVDNWKMLFSPLLKPKTLNLFCQGINCLHVYKISVNSGIGYRRNESPLVFKIERFPLENWWDIPRTNWRQKTHMSR